MTSDALSRPERRGWPTTHKAVNGTLYVSAPGVVDHPQQFLPGVSFQSLTFRRDPRAKIRSQSLYLLRRLDLS